MKTMPRLLLAALLLLLAPAALGWAQLGHRLIGELAQRHLTPAADAEVARLLAGEKDPTLAGVAAWRSEEHTSELQSLMRISYAVFCLKKKTTTNIRTLQLVSSAKTTQLKDPHAHHKTN